jgi:AcrR family transcriptional regulator
MTTDAPPGLRERKKLRTRRALSDVAVRLFREKGFDATTVEEICAAAEVSPSTFFRYFPTKEAVAFPDEEERIAVVERILRGHAADEPWPATIRRAVMALVERDLDTGKDLAGRLELLEREPALAAYTMQLQAATADRFTRILADGMGVDPRTDLRPRLVVAGAYAAVNTAWRAWHEDEGGRDLRTIVAEALDLLETGIGAALADPAPRGAR